jgi:F-type H+/Na+-transporting ATPase subunit alpha
MKQINDYLNETGEIGYVKKVMNIIVYASGLPTVKPEEVVIFENGDYGKVMTLSQDTVEIMTFSRKSIRVGEKVARTGKSIEIPVGNEILGKVIDPFGQSLNGEPILQKTPNTRPIEILPPGIITRKTINKQLDTGVGIVDLMVPIGHGQRQLIIGDRKTGKTNFLLQAVVSAAKEGTVCIYAAVGKKKIDIKKTEEYLERNNVKDKVIIIASTSQDPAGIIYITPYSAMTVAEYFRDQGQNTLLILDDMSTHAKFYREIALLANKFPGRNSYPGDIFYVHAKLLERAGNFSINGKDTAITCMPVVESPSGDFSGYIQTNIMSMTDGHLYFDSNLFAEGRRPAINPFLSVTRVGRQTQSDVKKSINREMLSFLTLFEKARNFSHFGAEVTDSVKVTLQTGTKVVGIFNQEASDIIPGNLQTIFVTLVWGQGIKESDTKKINLYRKRLAQIYETNKEYREFVDGLIANSKTFNDLLLSVQKNLAKVLPPLSI